MSMEKALRPNQDRYPEPPPGQLCIPFCELASQRLWAVTGPSSSPGPLSHPLVPGSTAGRQGCPQGRGPGPGPHPSWGVKPCPSDSTIHPPPTLPGPVQLLPTRPLTRSFKGLSTCSHFLGTKA